MEKPSSPLSIALAAERLLSGALVAFPTETVYGLGADASNADAVHAMYALKGRPADHPVIVHLATGCDPQSYFAHHVPPIAYQLIERFWPGPLTVILQRQPGHGDAAAAGHMTIGLRCPDHPVAQALLKEVAARRAGAGLAAPSANRFGHVSPTTAAHVIEEFGPSLDVLDGGPCRVGIESTILDLSRYDQLGAVLLRPGAVLPGELAQVLGAAPATADVHAPKASGTLAAHYAPVKPLYLFDAKDAAIIPDGVAVWSFLAASHAKPGQDWHRAPSDAARYAFALYRVLREFDAGPLPALYVERPPEEVRWAAVIDRLKRAAYPFAQQQ